MDDAYPIVYVRGYAMTQDEVEETFNSPYYGFNLGSTQIKLVNRELDKSDLAMLIFESPVVRLIKEEGYVDSFNRLVTNTNVPLDRSLVGADPPVDWHKTLWVFRFYDAESKLLGQHQRGKIDDYAEALAIFLHGVRRACGDPPGFKVNLVAHSMGGLICRSYLQNRTLFQRESIRALQPPITPVAINKFFTYGTPHRGISFRSGLGWIEDVRDLVGFKGSDSFGDAEMRRYLSLDDTQPLHTYSPARGELPLERIFNVVGTNYQDYVVAVSRKAVGPGSDGLVAIDNAYVLGAARAFIHRAHSGPLGMVNSEEGYQNLTRFLFGDLQVKALLEPITVVGHPPQVDPQQDRLDYLLVETAFVVRGLSVYIQALRNDHQSAITLDTQPEAPGSSYGQTRTEPTHLFTTYLRTSAKTTQADPYLRGAIDLRIEPHYSHAGVLRRSRFEGEAVLNDRCHIGVLPGAAPIVRYRWNSETADDTQLSPQSDSSYLVPLPAAAQRYLRSAGLRLVPSAWS